MLERRWADASNAVTVQPLCLPGPFKLGDPEFEPALPSLSLRIKVIPPPAP